MRDGQAVEHFDTKAILDRHGNNEQFENYYKLLTAENQNINLVSRETTRGDFDRLTAESAFPMNWLKEKVDSYLDIGSGGGFPAIPLLVGLPPVKSTTLVERTTKKSEALGRILDGMGIDGEILNRSFEEITFRQKFALITLRYIKLTPGLCKRIVKLLTKNGIFLYYSTPDFEVGGIDTVCFKSVDNPAIKSFSLIRRC